MTKSVGIIGLGLIGGSLSKALKEKCGIEKILVYDNNIASMKSALGDGIISNYTEYIDNSFYDCDIVFICTPVSYTKEIISKLIRFIKPNCIITDVGSTKSVLVNDIASICKNNIYIGGHPMAGSEKIGYSNSRAHLFENAYYILTPYKDTEKKYINILEDIIKKIGGLPIVLSPKEHDFSVGCISHVPHVIATSLVNMVKDLDNDDILHTLAAGGFKDITRIASSSPIMWHDICVSNREQMLSIIDKYIDNLNLFKENLEENNDEYINNFFSNAKNYRDSFSNKNNYNKTYEIYLDVLDQPGIIAIVSTILSSHSINIKNIGILNSREFENGVLQVIFETSKDMEKSYELLKNMNFDVFKR